MKRKEAKMYGLVTYTPDEPCHLNHWLRYTSTGTCVACLKIHTSGLGSRIKEAEDDLNDARMNLSKLTDLRPAIVENHKRRVMYCEKVLNELLIQRLEIML